LQMHQKSPTLRRAKSQNYQTTDQVGCSHSLPTKVTESGDTMSTSIANTLENGQIINKERILSVDVLRGFALFGILYSHMVFWYAGGALPEKLYQSQMSGLSILFSAIYAIFFIAKFFSIFSFLFGLSFYIQMRTLIKYGDNFVARFAWRLAILGMIGLLHRTFWRADILSIYVPLGFLLIAFRNISNRALLVIGCILTLNIPTQIAQYINLQVNNNYQFFQSYHDSEVALYFQTVMQDNVWLMCRDNLAGTIDAIRYQISSGRLLITFGFFLLGMLVGKLGWFDQPDAATKYFRPIWSKSWKVILGILCAVIVLGIAQKVLGIDTQKSPWAQMPFLMLYDFFNTTMAVFYITGITILLTKDFWLKWLSPLAAIGKMALTTYLTQSIIGVFLFFHVGFGLIGKTSPAQNIGICLLIFAVQIVFSRWWLARFYYGPVEWLWRSATFFKWQPFKKHPV